MGFTSVEEIKTRAKAEDCQLWEAILHDDDRTTSRSPRVHWQDE